MAGAYRYVRRILRPLALGTIDVIGAIAIVRWVRIQQPYYLR
jgi:hypothetical protein